MDDGGGPIFSRKSPLQGRVAGRIRKLPPELTPLATQTLILLFRALADGNQNPKLILRQGDT